MAHTKILIVADKKAVAENVESRLKELEYTVCAVVPTGAQAVEKAAENASRCSPHRYRT